MYPQLHSQHTESLDGGEGDVAAEVANAAADPWLFALPAVDGYSSMAIFSSQATPSKGLDSSATSPAITPDTMFAPPTLPSYPRLPRSRVHAAARTVSMPTQLRQVSSLPGSRHPGTWDTFMDT